MVLCLLAWLWCGPKASPWQTGRSSIALCSLSTWYSGQILALQCSGVCVCLSRAGEASKSPLTSAARLPLCFSGMSYLTEGE